MNPGGELKNRRVLIVDDNRDIHEDFRKILGVHPLDRSAHAAAEAALFGEPEVPIHPIGFELAAAHQGQEALELVKQAVADGRPYAVAFMDVRMPPGWDGIETTAQIWKVDPDLQVVLCTAYSDYSWDEMEKKLGQSDRLLILKKPFDNIEVLQMAASLTEKWSLQQQVHRQVDQLEDMVQRRTAQLSQSEERYRLITENSGDLVEIINAEGRPLYRSPSFERLFGFSAKELSETSTFDLFHADDREAIISTIRDCMQRGTQQVCDFRGRRKDGILLTFETHCGPFRNRDGAIEGVLMVSRDVTERRKLELQLREAQKLESIGQLASGIAHEINTPTQFIGDNTHFLRDAFADLQVMLGHYGELFAAAESGNITPVQLEAVRAARAAAGTDYLAIEIPKAIEETLNGVARTAKIINAMRNFSHPGSVNKTSVNLREVVDDALTITRNEWRYIADAATDFDPALPAVPVFPGEFSQVLLNLIINATHTIGDRVRDGSQGKGVITISAKHDGHWVEVRIRDTGMGIPEKIRDRIYDPFFTTKPIGKGTGQGLSIARSIIVDQHGGSLTFETVVGEGTVFIIRLPLPAEFEAR